VRAGEVAGRCSPLARQPLSAEQALELARLFKAMGDPARLRLLSLIASHEGGEACVCELTGVFDLSGPTISHHLKVLREAGLISGERRGTWIYYRVRPEALARLSALLVAEPASAELTGPAHAEAQAGGRRPPPPLGLETEIELARAGSPNSAGGCRAPAAATGHGSAVRAPADHVPGTSPQLTSGGDPASPARRRMPR
jgi:ArsR family transcriptional regulator, arsenate/arsenite/antimonite-responsive transcriptional repressor